MQERLHLIERLKRTHGGDVESVLRAQDQYIRNGTIVGQQSRGEAKAEMVEFKSYVWWKAVACL